MARRSIPRVEESPKQLSIERSDAATDLAAWSGKPKKSRGVSNSQLIKATERIGVMIGSTDWTDARPVDFVALYVWFHERVYKVAPLMSSQERHLAALMVGRVLNSEFSSNNADMAVFMRWVWKREWERMRWLKEQNRPQGRVIGWRLQWCNSMLTDYRVDCARWRGDKK